MRRPETADRLEEFQHTMHVMMLGLSHHATPVEVRERAAMSESKLPQTFANLLAYPEVLETVILSTCNRAEIYTVVESIEDGREALLSFMEGETGLSRGVLEAYAEFLTDAEAIAHLFRVAAGLESLVLGEGQILSQVKDAYAAALGHGGAGVILDRLFRAAVTAGKRARAETDIARGAVSVSSAAVELARHTLGDLTGATVLLLGAGKMSELAAKLLGGYGIGRVVVANRSFESAEQLANKVGGEAIPWIDMAPTLAHADVVICCTGAPHYILSASDVAGRLRERTSARPIVFIDISVPRNLDPELRRVPGVELFDIDDLHSVASRNRAERAGIVDEVVGILDHEIAEFQTWVKNFRLTPMITSLRTRIGSLRETELQRFWTKHSEAFTLEQQTMIEEMTQAMVNKILHQPTAELKRMSLPQQQRHASALKALFDLKVENLTDHYRRKIDERRSRTAPLSL